MGGATTDAAGDEAETHGWKSSKCNDSYLFCLVEQHLLQPRNVIHWRTSDGESFPHEGEDESIVFHPHVLRGLVFPFLISSEAFFTTGGFKYIS